MDSACLNSLTVKKGFEVGVTFYEHSIPFENQSAIKMNIGTIELRGIPIKFVFRSDTKINFMDYAGTFKP